MIKKIFFIYHILFINVLYNTIEQLEHNSNNSSMYNSTNNMKDYFYNLLYDYKNEIILSLGTIISIYVIYLIIKYNKNKNEIKPKNTSEEILKTTETKAVPFQYNPRN